MTNNWYYSSFGMCVKRKSDHFAIVFPPGKSGQEISRKFRVLKFPVFREIYVGFLAKFFLH